MIGLVLSVIVNYLAVGLLGSFKQPIRTDGPQKHLDKSGVPTMGGLAILMVVLLQAYWFDLLLHPIMIIYVGFALIGLFDDIMKVIFTSSRGMSAKYKFGLQWALAMWALYDMPNLITFWGQVYDVGLFYKLFGGVVIVGSSNAYNLTDGIDGLAASQALILFFFFGVFAIAVKEIVLAEIAAVFWIGVFGFFLFNRHPAKVFMGDVGSLSIGAVLGLFAIDLHVEWAYALAAVVMVIETLSVMVQVVCYKMGYGRVFKMAPIHHHLELSGWQEGSIVLCAATITFIASFGLFYGI